jgi:hypothetical protein
MKQQYRVRNWSEYNLALRQQGSLTFWVSEAVIEQWLNSKPSETMGAPPTYTDIAIMSMVHLKSLFRLGGRQTSGLMASLFELMQVELPVPDHSTVSRRMGKLDVTLPIVNREQARRSLSETTMFRHKTAFGGKVLSRKFENQATELLCQFAMLNRMIQLGKPVNVPVAA